MTKQEYYPRKLSDQPKWLIAYATQLITRGAEVGLSLAAINASVADALYLAYAIGAWLSATRDFGPDATAAVEMLKGGTGGAPYLLPDFIAPPLPAASAPLPATVPMPPGALDRIFKLVQVIKSSAGYTDELGKALGIVGSAPTLPLTPTGPEFSLKVEQGSGVQVVKVRFKKGGHMGVAIYSRRTGGDWVLLYVSTTSPYTDARPLAAAGVPEVREYRMRFWDDGEENGEWSAVQKETVAP